MKLRNLFLAGIAAFAMASCSNEVEGIDNGDNSNAEKNAVMQFRFAYGSNNGTGVRAYTDGAGLDIEQKFQQALLVGVYTEGKANAFVKTIARSEFTPITTTTDPATDGKYYQSTPFSVVAGTINSYVILNPTETMIKDLTTAFNDKAATVTVVETALKKLKVTAVSDAATSDKFIMYGNKANQNLIANATTAVSVSVDRIVAKMKEETTKVAYENIATGATGGTLDKAVTVTLNGYAFTNLTDQSNLVYQSDSKITSFISASIFDGVTDKTYTYKTMGEVANDKQIDYCFENENVVGDKSGSNITSIIYRATITATGINDTDANANVYIYNNKVYSYAQLQEAFKGLTLADGASIADYEALGIRKYAAGQCYYRKEITTTGAGNVIKRNNLYKLSVSTVNKIGFPTTIPASDPTMMLLNLEVNPWTVNDNAFDL
ncbi:Mfa1 family fimbria major subunit [Bacteroides bouchesdurhonensis]